MPAAIFGISRVHGYKYYSCKRGHPVQIVIEGKVHAILISHSSYIQQPMGILYIARILENALIFCRYAALE